MGHWVEGLSKFTESHMAPVECTGRHAFLGFACVQRSIEFPYDDPWKQHGAREGAGAKKCSTWVVRL